jgi:uncharacterized OsmC-like protein
MDAEQLRALQRPLKDQYREDADSGLVIHKATGNDAPEITFLIESRHGNVEVGLHPAAGGTGLQSCSGDLLLEALVGCAGVTLGSVSTAMGISIRKGTVRAEGELDYRGTMAVSKEVPVGFRSIRLIFKLDCDADEEKIKTMIKLTERYCVVYQTIAAATEIKSELISSSGPR